ncbi:hypothetical protein P691DRAFT_788998 [Macrolepiota fuliginosa MF-IS2]|uniref:glutathione synthase n=1 Tax=Macrolepiota fuliginosa MF-IS2 TaxID=1400762 RepID=A0A9P5XGI6_9AGAR|nr:hypothetical protein P691DRAFT_788998 [Macrolepiota fuliginosa MF-IS2]
MSSTADLEPPQYTEITRDTPIAAISAEGGTLHATRSLYKSEFRTGLQDENGYAWLVLRVKSRSPSAASIPFFMEGDIISGFVELDSAKTSSAKAVFVEIQAGTTAVGQEEETFLTLKETLWSLEDAKTTGELKRKYSWPFEFVLPKEVEVNDPHGKKGSYQLPPSFSERASPAYLDYRIVVTIKRGMLKVNQKLMTTFGYQSLTVPDSLPTPLRRLAYAEGKPLPNPKQDPEGWNMLPRNKVEGVLFGGKNVEIFYQLSIVRPLQYALGDPIPLHLVLESEDVQALDILSSPAAIRVELVRAMTTGFEATADHPDRRSDNFFRITLSRAYFWNADEPGLGPNRRSLQGEIDLEEKLKPTFTFPRLSIEYTINFVGFEATGWLAKGHSHKDKHLSIEPVKITSRQLAGVVMRSNAPPGYQKPEADYSSENKSKCLETSRYGSALSVFSPFTMSHNGQYLVGSVLERKPSGPAIPPNSVASTSHGFPAVQHRSKSAFARSREEARKSTPITKAVRPQAPPIVIPSRPSVVGGTGAEKPGTDIWRAQTSLENEVCVANMTDEEREAEKREILERFGADVGEVLMRARLAREKKAAKDQRPLSSSDADEVEVLNDLPEVPISDDEPAPRQYERGVSPPPALSHPGSRPASRMDRRLRFAELNPNDVYVYESAPSSPKRKPLALPPATNDGSAVSLGQWNGKTVPSPSQPEMPEPIKADVPKRHEPEEGTAEYIRQRYFPNAPANDPNLAWMQGSSTSDQSSTSLRFDLHGNVIPPSIATRLPIHLGLHHHAEGITAGYTLDDIFLLSRSTVPAQRATMMDVLAHIILNLGKAKKGNFRDLDELVPQAEGMRKRVMAAGAEAMNERGGVGTRAIEVIWAAVVGWEEDTTNLEGVDLQQDSDTAIASLQLDFFLPQIATALSQGDTAPGSLTQLLAILHRLAQQSNKTAESIVQTPKLIASVFQTFLLTPIPPKEDSPLPEPAALQLLITLTSASRANAEALQEPADALLRFITPLPPSSPFSLTLATSLLTLTLHLYTSLASYGLYSNITTTAMEPFLRLNQYIFSPVCASQKLIITWLNLLNAWIVCSVDPHKTTPDHDILWSQVVGWGWKDEVAQFSGGLGDVGTWEVWGAVWRVQAQWLEGSKVNGVKGGEAEREEFVESVRGDFHDGVRSRVVHGVLDVLQRDLGVEEVVTNSGSAALHAGLLSAAIRLWLACLPPHLEGPPPSPPFELPFPRISEVCAKLVVHPLWNNVNSNEVDPRSYVHARQFSELLAAYLALSRRLPSISEELWVAQALSILLRLLPGDEEVASAIAEVLIGLITSDWVGQRHIPSPTIIWEKGGLSVLRPFLSHIIIPNKNSRISPLQITPKSIAISSTSRLPMVSNRRNFGLPLHRDWALSPMNHLLRSAESEVFKHLPAGWDSSEVEVTRATLFLSNLSRDILARFSLEQFMLSKEEAVFGCMRVLMLEHGQPENSTSGEVFRDNVVEKLMNQLLRPYSYGASGKLSIKGHQTSAVNLNLEHVAARFLGGSTPFFQFYTDLVALYDAISFSDTTFAKLLLPPISMHYASDYRKHFWDDFSHILKTIRTPCEQVLSGNLKEYLYPVESDPHLIGAYLRALLKEPLQGFVRLVAVHHIASSIWPDLREGDTSNEVRAEKLIKAVVTQGNNEVVREVASYRQTFPGPTWVPPECFECVGELAEGRLRRQGPGLGGDKSGKSYHSASMSPSLECAQLEELTVYATTYAISHGLLYLPPVLPLPKVPSAAIHAPLALFPSPIPKGLFERAQRLQRIYNVLYSRVALDDEFLDEVMGVENGVGKVDEFIGQLWRGWKTLRDEGIDQSLHLGLFRSDYLLHSPAGQEPLLKQVEFNTISSSFGPLSQRVSELHRYLYRTTGYFSVSSHLRPDKFPANETISGLAAGLAAAHTAYSPSTSTRILVVTQDNERNVFDQRWLEYELLDKFSIRMLRQTLTELGKTAKVDPTTRKLYIEVPTDLEPSGSVEISVVYFRAAYTPTDFPTPTQYTTRFLLERSTAIKCPSLALQLAGGKKIQEVLAQEGILEKFLADTKRYKQVFSKEEIQELRDSFMGMWGLDVGDDLLTPDTQTIQTGKENYGVRKAREEAKSLVLKPQREGGGNNVYKEDIPAFLDKLPPQERQAWIAMQLIVTPANVGNYLIRAGSTSGSSESQMPVKTDVISELGIFGWSLFGKDGVDSSVKEETVGWLVRTKGTESNEGGVATGFSVLDSILLVD